jgi:hypothetical protein
VVTAIAAEHHSLRKKGKKKKTPKRKKKTLFSGPGCPAGCRTDSGSNRRVPCGRREREQPPARKKKKKFSKRLICHVQNVCMEDENRRESTRKSKREKLVFFFFRLFLAFDHAIAASSSRSALSAPQSAEMPQCFARGDQTGGKHKNKKKTKRKKKRKIKKNKKSQNDVCLPLRNYLQTKTLYSTSSFKIIQRIDHKKKSKKSGGPAIRCFDCKRLWGHLFLKEIPKNFFFSFLFFFFLFFSSPVGIGPSFGENFVRCVFGSWLASATVFKTLYNCLGCLFYSFLFSLWAFWSFLAVGVM